LCVGADAHISPRERQAAPLRIDYERTVVGAGFHARPPPTILRDVDEHRPLHFSGGHGNPPLRNSFCGLFCRGEHCSSAPTILRDVVESLHHHSVVPLPQGELTEGQERVAWAIRQGRLYRTLRNCAHIRKSHSNEWLLDFYKGWKDPSHSFRMTFPGTTYFLLPALRGRCKRPYGRG